MAWLAIVVGVVIGYMIYQRRQQSSQAENDHPEYNRSMEGTNSSSYATRNMQADPYHRAGSADEYREISEAIDAGERALESLRTAKSKLDSARAWGIYDIVGGGFL